jgi:hypothetical protein
MFIVKTVLVVGNTAFPRQSESEGGLVLYIKFVPVDALVLNTDQGVPSGIFGACGT